MAGPTNYSADIEKRADLALPLNTQPTGKAVCGTEVSQIVGRLKPMVIVPEKGESAGTECTDLYSEDSSTACAALGVTVSTHSSFDACLKVQVALCPDGH